ncbi:hypothetical protein BK798_04350 [Methanobrevibacter smithii]|uniref:Type I restriction modification DNA specificity domain-containing protein n=1 Tax=Methanobrevibacter smithii TaxID=2173 RepID=A0A2H4U6H3_METSM|nr:restriction endonuclease subunit S [Methanobrevibacter smithii]ATZ59703.1 hypothetical protein BK798_04350 [Methanobrevibacter smithii]
MIDGDRGKNYPKQDEFTEDGFCLFLNAKNVTDNGFNFETKMFISQEKDEILKKGKLQRGDVILTTRGTVGNVAFYSENIPFDNIRINSGMLILRSKSELSNKFLYYVLKSDFFKKQIYTFKSGTAQPQLPISSLNHMKFYLPKINIQKKIVTILSNIDKKIKVLEEINKNLLSIADAVFKKEFRNFEGYSEDDLITSDFGLIPKDWYYNTLDEISDVAIGKTPPRKETWWFSEKEGVKWVSIKDLGNSGTYVFETSEYLTEEAIEKFNVKLIPEDTIILSFKLTVGRLGITTEEMVTNEAIAHFKLDENSLISKEYLYLYLKNFNYEELGSTSSIAKAINSKIVKKIPVLIPTNNKMEEFKKLFENIFNEIKSNQLEINSLTKLRDTLLPKLMSGEINVSKINCDLELKYNYMKYLFNQIHTPIQIRCVKIN